MIFDQVHCQLTCLNCESTYDSLDVIGIMENIKDPKKQLERAADILMLPYDEEEPLDENSNSEEYSAAETYEQGNTPDETFAFIDEAKVVETMEVGVHVGVQDKRCNLL